MLTHPVMGHHASYSNEELAEGYLKAGCSSKKKPCLLKSLRQSDFKHVIRLPNVCLIFYFILPSFVYENQIPFGNEK